MHLIRSARRLALAAAVSVAASVFASDVASTPPVFADAEHVFNGCHISSVAYLARFAEAHPGESGRHAVLVMDNADGVRRPHTIALVTWGGEWWGRDEYFGVFRVGFKVDSNPSTGKLEARAAAVLARISARRDRTAGYRRPPMARGELNHEKLAREASVAARLLPYASTTYWVSEGAREYPLVFFRPDEKTVAVYDPHRGTCVAETDARDAARVVAAVAELLGYKASSVRAELPATAAMVAMAR